MIRQKSLKFFLQRYYGLSKEVFGRSLRSLIETIHSRIKHNPDHRVGSLLGRAAKAQNPFLLFYCPKAISHMGPTWDLTSVQL